MLKIGDMVVVYLREPDTTPVKMVFGGFMQGGGVEWLCLEDETRESYILVDKIASINKIKGAQ